MKRGFTLIEILVSVAIFTVVMVVALGALLSVSVSDRKAESLKEVINNLDFSLDSMTRTIRTGYNYSCGTASAGDCDTGSTLYITPSNGGTAVAYRLEDSTTDTLANATSVCNQPGPAVGCIAYSVDAGITWFGITAPEVIICGSSTGGSCPPGSSDSVFYLIGSGSPMGTADKIQPKVTISLTGYVPVSATQTSQFHIQTSVTQRLYDQ